MPDLETHAAADFQSVMLPSFERPNECKHTAIECLIPLGRSVCPSQSGTYIRAGVLVNGWFDMESAGLNNGTKPVLL